MDASQNARRLLAAELDVSVVPTGSMLPVNNTLLITNTPSTGFRAANPIPNNNPSMTALSVPINTALATNVSVLSDNVFTVDFQVPGENVQADIDATFGHGVFLMDNTLGKAQPK